MSDFSSRPPGRPRSQKVHRAILKAARELLLEVGIYEMSIEKVAERARVGKATIYRRWSSKDELIAEAMGGLTDEIILPNSGGLY